MDGAKPPQAGSTESLMFPAESKELFYHKKCKFTFQGVDQTLRRPLAVFLSEIAVEDRTTSKISGQFQKAKLRLRRLFSLQPKVQHYSAPASLRVTSLCGVGCLRNFVRNKAFLISRRHPEHARIVAPMATHCSHLRARRSFAEVVVATRRGMEQNRDLFAGRGVS